MIIAPGCRRRADEYAVNEEGHRDFLPPQPRVTESAGNNVKEHRRTEPRQGDAAEHHQDLLDQIQRSPFEMAVLLSSTSE